MEYLGHIDLGPPECGVDFDDGCGCCLACYGGECDYATGWVMYVDDGDERLERASRNLFAWLSGVW